MPNTNYRFTIITDSTPSFMKRFRSFLHFLKTPKGIAFSLVSLAIVFNAVFLWSEEDVSMFSLNDDVSHLTATQEASLAPHQNLNPWGL